MRKTRDPSGMEDTVIDPKKEVIIQKDDYSLRLDGLLPRSLYSVNITVAFIDGTWGPPFSTKMETGLDGKIFIYFLACCYLFIYINLYLSFIEIFK